MVVVVVVSGKDELVLLMSSCVCAYQKDNICAGQSMAVAVLLNRD